MRFVYITDTHLGGDRQGYHQQPRYPDRLPELLQCLDGWIRSEGNIDLVLHGGDMVEHATPEALREARECFRLSVPVVLSLGNHDLTAPDAPSMWIAEASDFFPGGKLNPTVDLGDLLIHVVPTQWCATPFYWDDVQQPHLLPEHLAALEEELARRPAALHILATHSEVLGVPVEQTGFAVPYHAPPPAFTTAVLELAARHPQLRAVLSGHTHINMHVLHGHTHIVTASSFVETPFEAKVVELTPEACTMRTLTLLPEISFAAAYDFDRTFVQGRPRDRGFEGTRSL